MSGPHRTSRALTSVIVCVIGLLQLSACSSRRPQPLLAPAALETYPFRWSCGVDGRCVIESFREDGQWSPHFGGDTRAPRVRRLNDRITELQFDCGLDCTTSMFADVFSLRYSGPFVNVIAVDPRAGLVAAATGNTLVVFPMLDVRTGPRLRVIRDFSPVEKPASAIKRAEFVGGHSLKIRYLLGPAFKEQEETIPLGPAGNPAVNP